MRISPLPTSWTGAFLLAVSSGRLESNPSSENGTKIEGEQKEGSMFMEEVFDSIETRSSPPKGEGVFVTRTIPKGTFVCRYVGDLLTNDEQEERYPIDGDWPEYCLRLSSELRVDGAHSCHWSRYVNHNEKPNLAVKVSGIEKFEIDGETEPFAYFETIRTIDVGEELSFDYGPVYFHVRGIVPAPGTESRTVKEYQESISSEEEKEEEEREDEAWKKLGLPEVPTTVEEIRKIAESATMKIEGGDGLWVTAQRKKATFVRALDYFGALEWIDDDSFSVTIERNHDGDPTTIHNLDYPSVGVDELAKHLEDVIQWLSQRK